jgi:DNA repair protein RecO (recombination protein O)
MKTVEQGIVLKRSNYSENSLMVSLLTLEGIKRYIFPGGKKKSGHILQPLSRIEVTAYKRPESDLPRITAVTPSIVFQDLPFNPIKSGLAFFLAELLMTTFSDGDIDAKTYAWIEEEIHFIDVEHHLANYPSWFLIRLTKDLGILPELQAQEVFYFDLEEGLLMPQRPMRHTYIQGDAVQHVAFFIRNNKQAALALQLSKSQRKQLLQDILRYYQFQLDHFKVPKSLEVLEVVFG